MAHIVTAPLVITKREDGSDLYLYEGSQLPDSVSTDEIKRLSDLGMVDKVGRRKPRRPPRPPARTDRTAEA
jgi:hypothetical protein